MTTVIAYLLVVPLAPFVFYCGPLFLGGLLACANAWIPGRLHVLLNSFLAASCVALGYDRFLALMNREVNRDAMSYDRALGLANRDAMSSGRLLALLSSFLAGCGASLVAMSLGFVVFTCIVGAGSFGIWPFAATALPLSIPMLVHYRRCHQPRCIVVDVEHMPSIGDLPPPKASFYRTVLLGDIIGILIGGCLFASW